MNGALLSLAVVAVIGVVLWALLFIGRKLLGFRFGRPRQDAHILGENEH